MWLAVARWHGLSIFGTNQNLRLVETDSEISINFILSFIGIINEVLNTYPSRVMNLWYLIAIRQIFNGWIQLIDARWESLWERIR